MFTLVELFYFIFISLNPSTWSRALTMTLRRLEQLLNPCTLIFSFSTLPGLSGCYPCVFLTTGLRNDHCWRPLNKPNPHITFIGTGSRSHSILKWKTSKRTYYLPLNKKSLKLFCAESYVAAKPSILKPTHYHITGFPLLH